GLGALGLKPSSCCRSAKRSIPCGAGAVGLACTGGGTAGLVADSALMVVATRARVGSQASTGDREFTGLRSSDSRLPEPGVAAAGVAAAGCWSTLVRLVRAHGSELTMGSAGAAAAGEGAGVLG